jgi:hypothetical protein
MGAYGMRFQPGAFFPVKGLQQVTPNSALNEALDAIAANRLARDQMASQEERARAQIAAEAEQNRLNRAATAQNAQDLRDHGDVAKFVEVANRAMASKAPGDVHAAQTYGQLPGVLRQGYGLHRQTAEEQMPLRSPEELVGRSAPGLVPQGDIGPRPEMPAALPARPANVNMDDPASVERGIAEREAYNAQGGDAALSGRLRFILGPRGMPIPIDQAMVDAEKAQQDFDMKQRQAEADQWLEQDRWDAEVKSKTAEEQAKRQELIDKGLLDYVMTVHGKPILRHNTQTDVIDEQAQILRNAAGKVVPTVKGKNGNYEETGRNAMLAGAPLAALTDKPAEAALGIGGDAAKRHLDEINARQRAAAQVVIANNRGNDKDTDRFIQENNKILDAPKGQMAKLDYEMVRLDEAMSQLKSTTSLGESFAKAAIRKVVTGVSGSAREMASYDNSGTLVQRLTNLANRTLEGISAEQYRSEVEGVIIEMGKAGQRGRARIAEQAYVRAKKSPVEEMRGHADAVYEVLYGSPRKGPERTSKSAPAKDGGKDGGGSSVMLKKTESAKGSAVDEGDVDESDYE